MISVEFAGREIIIPSSVMREPSGKSPLNAAIAMAFLGAGTRWYKASNPISASATRRAKSAVVA